MSAGELTSFLSCNVPSSLDAAHNDELSLLKGVETVRVRLPGRGERERDAKSSYSGEVRNSCFAVLKAGLLIPIINKYEGRYISYIMLIYYCSFLLSVGMGSVVISIFNGFSFAVELLEMWGGGGKGEEGDTGRGSAPRYCIPCKVLHRVHQWFL